MSRSLHKGCSPLCRPSVWFAFFIAVLWIGHCEKVVASERFHYFVSGDESSPIERGRYAWAQGLELLYNKLL
jgi:hypothetical protein